MTKFRSVMPKPSGLRPEILAEEQEPPPSGHPGSESTLTQPALNNSLNQIKNAEMFFNIPHWSQKALHINEQGNLSVDINGIPLDLFGLAQHLAKKQDWPVLLRFPALIKKNIFAIQNAFYKAIKQTNYSGNYTLAFPLKVNPHVSVAKTMMQCENVTFEVGNKAELIIALTHVAKRQVILCNGFKDTHYLSLILDAAHAGQKMCLIFETLEELDTLYSLTQEIPENMFLGVRLRLNTPIAGHWEDSNGQHSKFGLSSLEMLHVIEKLKHYDFLSSLKLLHVHPGSQIVAIKELASCFKECIRYYHELVKLGAPIQTVDIGGGLAMDYSGEHKDNLRDYTLDDYAMALIHPMTEYCREHNLPHPNVISETGRHTLALSSMLLTNVKPLGKQEELEINEPDLTSPFIRQLWELHQFIVGFYNLEHAEAVHTQQESLLKSIQTQFVNNELSLAELAWAEKVCAHNHALLSGPAGYQKYLANFSLFQSTPDYWGIDQFFPMLSLHGYQNELAQSAVFYDLTCDSDGVVKNYLHPDGIQSQLQLPDCPVKFMGIFLLGAYQEIMASGHNLFERLPCLEIDWTIDNAGEQIIETHLYPACDIAESLVDIGYDKKELAKNPVVKKYLHQMNYMGNEL